MPTLEWIGKNKVVNHHLEVPYQVLQRVYSYDEKGQHPEDNGSENKIIHGDNLAALKSLLPQYEGKIKCIYIDPPYNTGNEGWVYNDNVNDPRIQKWLGEVVGKEGEDLSRHDKWLCMMYPRLRLLQKLLAEDGVIFISIDDNEQANLKLVCDEIFGEQNFVCNVIWEKKYTLSNDAKWFSDTHDFIVIYAKNKSIWIPNPLPRTNEMNKAYKNPDNDPRGPWKSTPLHAKSGSSTMGEFIYHFKNGVIWTPPKGTFPRYSTETLSNLEEHNEIWFGKNGKSIPSKKTFLSNLQKSGVTPKTIWKYDEVGHNHEAKTIVNEIFNERGIVFDTPKPPRLIQRILQIATHKDSIILDSFAGSGTTAHAVLNLNQQDGGHRKFILIEMMDYADTITAERVKRVIHGYGEGKNAVPGTGGSFSYYELGQPIFHGDFLNEEIGLEEIRKYVYFTETRQPAEPIRPEEPAYLGKWMDTVYYFHYARNAATTLNWDFLAKVRTKGESYVMYADRCTLSEEELQKYHITFKKIPRDIARF
jgi:adenine-specific DNA-methyltransferase